MIRLLLLMILIASTVAGCDGAGRPIRIGSKSFAEQQILTGAAAMLIRRSTGGQAVVEACGTSYSCESALREGRIDMMVEYTGTGLSILGPLESDEAESLEHVRALYANLGVRWIDPFGFDNGFRVVMRSDRASALGIKTIADLEKVPGGVRVASPLEYLRRAVDGLPALTRRHGFQLASAPLVVDDATKRFDAVIDGRADVAVGYATDATIRDSGLVVLSDSLTFFPRYEGALVVREATLASHPSLLATLGQLSGRIDTEAMRRYNYAVQVEGYSPTVVARRLLIEHGIGAASEEDTRFFPELVVAVESNEPSAEQAIEAQRAVRAVFPGRPVRLVNATRPAEEVGAGRARFGVMSAESFFGVNGEGVTERESRVEAVVVLETPVLHLVRRKGDTSEPLGGRVGIVADGASGHKAGAAVLHEAGRAPAMAAAPSVLLAKLGSGELDAALVLVKEGDATLEAALASNALALFSFEQPTHGGRNEAAPYLRPLRIPAHTYTGQDGSIEALGVQVVLAAPARGRRAAFQTGGQGGGLPAMAKPLTADETEAFMQAVRLPEPPDPTLPSAWADAVPNEDDAPSAVSWLDPALNALMLLFLGWLVSIIVAPDRPRGPRLHA